MPTLEAIVNTVIPREVEKPIPTRVVSTRTAPRTQNLNQGSTNVDTAAVDSVAPAESVKLSPQLTALARKEQAYRQREQALKEREKALEAKLADADNYSQLKSKFAAKDFSGAEELGLTYDEHLKYALDKQAGEDPNTLKFRELEAEIQALKKGREEHAAKEYEDTVADYRKEITKLADTDPAFAKVKKFKDLGPDGKEISGADIALQFILDSFNEDEEEVSVDEALKLTTDFLTERAKKWAALNDDEPKVEAEVVPKVLPQPRVGATTLTQQMQASSEEKKPQRSLQHMSEQERYAEARRRVEERNRLQQGNR